MKKWKIKSDVGFKTKDLRTETLVDILLENRGIVTQEEKEAFLYPKLEEVTMQSVGIDRKEVEKTLQRLKDAFEKKEQIIVFGDYDVDGITGTAILWETLYSTGFNVLPYIPSRVDEGYGLSVKALQNPEFKNKNVQLIITVDNGIVATEAVDFANSLGIDVIITDHHLPETETKRPNAYAIVHTTKLCGAGVAWLLSQEIRNEKDGEKDSIASLQNDSHLELAALGTIADLVPLQGANRTIVMFGLKKLRQTKRLGLLALFQEAKIKPEDIGTYEVGYMIGPRLNAAGRIESAMDSLRLLCTNDRAKAEMLASRLGEINLERQTIMKTATADAIARFKFKDLRLKKILFIGDASYNPGIIGLVAGKLVEEFYRPSIVLSIGDIHAKASVRSISGFNIISFLRTHADMYVNVGGHPMAAGFTVETKRMQELQEKLEVLAEEHITDEMLERTLSVDCELPLSVVTLDLFFTLQQLAPFGMGNPEPVFVSKRVEIADMKLLGKEKNHLKLRLKNQKSGIKNQGLDAIGFSMGKLAESLQIGDTVDIAYTIDENVWNGNTTLQLKLKDIVPGNKN